MRGGGKGSRTALWLATRSPCTPRTRRGLPSPSCRVGCAGFWRQARVHEQDVESLEGAGARAAGGERACAPAAAAAEGWGPPRSARARWEPREYLAEAGARKEGVGLQSACAGGLLCGERGSRARARRRDSGNSREICWCFISTQSARVLSLVRFCPARLCCSAEAVCLRPPSLSPKCALPPHGRFYGHGHEPSEAPELPFR